MSAAVEAGVPVDGAAFTVQVGRTTILQVGPLGLAIGPGLYVWAGKREAFVGRLDSGWHFVAENGARVAQ